MERSYTDLGWLKEWTEVRAEIVEPGFELRPIIPPATTLYDTQLGWIEDDGSIVITDIGGQGEPGWNPEKGHGSIFKLHPDNRVEPIVPYGNTGRAMIMSTIKSPPNFGEYSNRPFPLGQLRPGRQGAHNTHAVFWVPPGASWVEHYVVVPDSGSINGGKSGALMGPGWGEPGTPEDGFMFVVSMFNCTMYKVTSTRQIWPYVVGDTENAGIQFMPRWIYRAPQSWGQHAGKLICEGVANHSFSSPAPKPGEPPLVEKIVHFVVDDQGEGQKAKLTQIDASGLPPYEFPDWPSTMANRYRGAVAPKGFGAFGGQQFVVDMGSVNLMQTSTMPDEALPYDAAIYRIDEKGERHLFVKNLQAGHPQVKFHAGRLLIGAIGKSYSTGDFHYPDGSLMEIVYTG
jgi:hypothetical protein